MAYTEHTDFGFAEDDGGFDFENRITAPTTLPDDLEAENPPPKGAFRVYRPGKG